MRPVDVVVVDVLGQERAEVAVIQRDGVVEALPPERADHPFGDGVRTPGQHRSEHGVDAKGFGLGADVTAVSRSRSRIRCSGRRPHALASTNGRHRHTRTAVGWTVTARWISSPAPVGRGC
jgi:hypothetical protein